MASVDDFINAIQRNLIDPLQQMPLAQIRQLDGLHDQSVMDFQHAIGRLYAPPGPFVGKTADSVAAISGRFLTTEGQISQYDSAGHSQRMDQLVQLCQQVVADLKPMLSALQNSRPLPVATGMAVVGEEVVNPISIVPGPENPAWDLGQFIIVVLVGTAITVADAYQKYQVLQIWHRVTEWEDAMTHLAQQPEPSLPPDPSQPVAAAALADATFIVNSITETVKDMRRILRSEGINVSEQDIWKLLNQGLTVEEVLDLFRKRAQLLKYLQKQGISSYNKEELFGLIQRGFTFDQIAAILVARAYLINPKGLVPYTQSQIETYARAGLSGQDIVDALLLGIPPTESADAIRQQLADVRSRILGLDGNPADLNTVRSHERRTILLLASEGYILTIIPEGGSDRKADVIIQGIGKVELKYLQVQPGDHQQQLMEQIGKSVGGTPQADHMIIDGRDNGITELEAENAVRKMADRLDKKHVKWVRIIGFDYDITISIPDLTVSTNS